MWTKYIKVIKTNESEGYDFLFNDLKLAFKLSLSSPYLFS